MERLKDCSRAFGIYGMQSSVVHGRLVITPRFRCYRLYVVLYIYNTKWFGYCYIQPLPEFIFANHAALEMLESSSSDLREMSLEKMFNDGCRKTDYPQPPPFLQKEVCFSLKARTFGI